jgi:hypothetical protein
MGWLSIQAALEPLRAYPFCIAAITGFGVIALEKRMLETMAAKAGWMTESTSAGPAEQVCF